MAGPLILHIETSTDICSVALSEGKEMIALAESGPDRSHATLLSAQIRKLFEESGRELKQIDAVAVSKGPGSYTGLRIGVSTAKGIAYALEKPLLASGTLLNMTHGALAHPAVKELVREHGSELLLCPMIDARRMEVYSAVYTVEMKRFREVKAEVLDEGSYREILEQHPVCFFGNGSVKLETVVNHSGAFFIRELHPSASQMIEPALVSYREKRFEDVAYFEPFYLKEFIATIPRKKVL